MPPKPKKDNLDDLKQELDIDYHKITSEELYQRFQTHPENVSLIVDKQSSSNYKSN
jgi:sodium/potassium-transporting ATPase subunit alpha